MPIDYVRSAHFGCLGMRPQTQSNRETKLSPGGGCYQVAATDVAKVVPFSQSISGEGRVQSAKVSEPKMENDRTTDHVSRFIILDTDMGADDAWALHLLLRAEAELKNVTLLAITCVHGNTSMNYVVRNTYRVLNALNRTDIPIYKGAVEALIPGTGVAIEPFHGIDGMSDIDHDDGPDFPGDIASMAQKENAVEIIHRLVMDRPKQITIIGIGPLTNIALALKTYPGVRDNVRDLFVMGGNYNGVGNTTRCAEFNFFQDPEAAHIVLNTARCPITILPWEACEEENLPIPLHWRMELIAENGSRFLEIMNKVDKTCYKDYSTWAVCDALLICVLLSERKTVKKSRMFHATVELAGQYTRGQMVLDHLRSMGDNVKIIDLLSADECMNLFKWSIEQNE